MAVTVIARNTPLATKAELLPQEPAKPQRRVSVDETRNVFYTNNQWTQEDCKNAWFTPSEHQEMKANAMTLAKQFNKRERRITSEESYQNVVLRVYDLCCEAQKETNRNILCEEDQALLAKLVGKACTRTGIEKVFIREIAYDKRQRRSHVVEVILKIQASAHEGSSSTSRTKLMRLASERITRASRLFARHMAEALEVSNAVQQ